jgi:hypothetical protein
MRSGTSCICNHILKPVFFTLQAQGLRNQSLSGAMGHLDSTCTGAPPMRTHHSTIQCVMKPIQAMDIVV